MLPIETAAPATFRRVHTECAAMKVNQSTRERVAAWCGGQVWAEGVIVPVPPGGETHAPDGTWVVQSGAGFGVWPDEAFLAQWRLA